jgi:hypothetical protein
LDVAIEHWMRPHFTMRDIVDPKIVESCEKSFESVEKMVGSIFDYCKVLSTNLHECHFRQVRVVKNPYDKEFNRRGRGERGGHKEMIRVNS